MPPVHSTNRKSRIFVLEGNPGQSTFCQVLADSACEDARAGGAEVKYLRLSQMQFDSNLAEGYRQVQKLEPDLTAVQEALAWCDKLVLVHPLWWGSAPARLKGLFDRTLLPGFAFKYADGKDFPEKLLKGKTAHVLISSDTPEWYLRWGYGDGWPKILRKQILGFCGFEKVKIKTLGPLRKATGAQRAAMLLDARKFLKNSNKHAMPLDVS